MKHFLVIFFLFLSIPSFSKKNSCSDAFSKNNEQPFTSDSIYSLQFKGKVDFVSMTTMIGGATVGGAGAVTGELPLMILGGVIGAVGIKLYGATFRNDWQQAKFSTFKRGLILKYLEKAVDTFAKKRVNFINQAVPFIGFGLSKRDAKRLIQFLINEGENINESIGETQSTPMHLAAKTNNPSAIEVLYELGGDIHIKNAEGLTPLTVALNKKANKAQRALVNILAQEASRKALQNIEKSIEKSNKEVST